MRSQAELQRKHERLKLVLDISQSVASTLDVRQLCRLISSGIRPVLQCDGAMLALPEPDKARLRVCGLDFPDSKGFQMGGVVHLARKDNGEWRLRWILIPELLPERTRQQQSAA